MYIHRAMKKDFSKILSDTLIVIPTYNNQTTLGTIVNDILNYSDNILVVNDGSTDNTSVILNSLKDSISILTNIENKGKGFSIKKAFEHALENDYKYVVTIDSDGQHFAEDIPKFIEFIADNGDTLLVGSRNMKSENVPGKSSFGHKFSNFWYWAETGENLIDTQSGFRLYPLKQMSQINFYTNRFEFEVEVLVRGQWNGIIVRNIPVNVHYDEPGIRISHFRPLVDFSRISVLNTVLFTISIIYIHPRNFFRYLEKNSFSSLLKKIFKENSESPDKIAKALGLGVFMGILPVWGFQMLIAVILAHKLKLNKAMVLLASNISLPPMIPVLIYLGYQIGHYVFNGAFDSFSNITYVTNNIINEGFYNSMSTLGKGFLYYLIGSIILALISAIFVWLITHTIFIIKKSRF